MTPSPGIEPRPHWWEASALPLRHHCFHFSQFLLIPFHMIHWRHIIFLILISRPTRISHVSQPILHGSKISAFRLNSTPTEFCSGFLIQLHMFSRLFIQFIRSSNICISLYCNSNLLLGWETCKILLYHTCKGRLQCQSKGDDAV